MSYYPLISIMPKTPAFTGLLDIYPSASVAYSLRKLRSAYTGNCIKVRRSSDNTSQDIGFINNVLDTASLLTFCGVGDGFVSEWYDQSGNTKNATQITAANQPRIVNAGVLDLVNGKAAVLGDGVSDTLFNNTLSLSNPSSIFTVVDKVGNTGVFGLITGLNRLGGAFSLTTTGYTFYQDGAVFSPTYVNNNQALLVAKTSTTGTDWEFYGNNTVVTNSGENIGTAIGTRVYLFDRFAAGSRANMYMQEYIVWNSNQMANRAGIQTNINTYYNIYP
jgi:hypothetical protein